MPGPERPPRVLVNALALHDSRDAARTFLENLIERLPDAWPEADVHVLARHGVRIPGESRVRVVRIRALGSGIARVADDLLRLPRAAERVDADVVVSPNESVPTRLRRPVVVVAQNLLYHCPQIGPLDAGSWHARLRSRLQFRFYRWQMPRAYARADVVVTVSEHAAHELAERAGLDLARVRIVPYGADRLPVAARREPASPRMLLTLGSLAHYKRLDVAIRALAQLRRDGGDYELVLAGGAWPGVAESLERLARELGVADAVRLTGSVDPAGIASLFSEAHAFVSLSACESFGIPVVEAMRAGVPAVVADEPWSAETVGDAAVRVDTREPRAVAAGIRLLADPEEWRRRSEIGIAAAARYTWSSNAEGVAAAAAAVVGRGRAR